MHPAHRLRGSLLVTPSSWRYASYVSIILELSMILKRPVHPKRRCHPASGGSQTQERAMARHALAVVGHLGPGAAGDPMSGPHALSALAALGQPTRLEIFRLLMRHEPGGLAAGSVAETIGCPHNTLSSHLGILARAGLIRGTREGRSIMYRADVESMRTLIAFLVTDCCSGHPELCNLQDALYEDGCCVPARKANAARKR